MKRDTALRRRILVACVGLTAYSLLSPSVWGQPKAESVKRSALVIGNATYAFGKLRNPVNDARAVSAALQEMGFDVARAEDADLSAMLEAMKEFVAHSQDSEVRLLFYAGHGIQAKGKNYLVPVDATLIDEDKLDARMVSVSELIDKLGALKSGVNIVILDACRTGVAANVRKRGPTGARSLAAGLAQMNAPRGTLIAFSTAPGSVALDGKADNSAYTKHLVDNMRLPGLPVEQLFKRVRISVAEDTKQSQIPWETSSLMGDFCFLSNNAGTCVNAVTATGARTER
jgi:uncharacterized caspase-like protein